MPENNLKPSNSTNRTKAEVKRTVKARETGTMKMSRFPEKSSKTGRDLGIDEKIMGNASSAQCQRGSLHYGIFLGSSYLLPSQVRKSGLLALLIMISSVNGMVRVMASLRPKYCDASLMAL